MARVAPLVNARLEQIRAADEAAGDALQGCPQAWTDRRDLLQHITALEQMEHPEPAPIPMLLWCPGCQQRHVDAGEFAVRPHHTHACQVCGMVWRPALVPTVGVHFLPGYKNPEPEPELTAEEIRNAGGRA